MHSLQTCISYRLKNTKIKTTIIVVTIKANKAVVVCILQKTINSSNKNKVKPKANNLITNCNTSIY